MAVDRYAVFGQPIAHSKSPLIHRLFAQQCGQDIEYTAQEVAPENFPGAVADFFSAGGRGLNCTLPLKELAWRLADKSSTQAERAKAVNTLIKLDDGTVYGDNTDGLGLLRDLTVNHGIPLAGRRILLVGAGGAGRGILQPLLTARPAELVIVNRTREKAESLAAEFADLGNVKACGFTELANRHKPFDLILNATSASLTNELPPLSKEMLAEFGQCYDLAYGREPTAFVRWGLDAGATLSLDGLGMLVEQAAEAFYRWRGVRPETGPVIEQMTRYES